MREKREISLDNYRDAEMFRISRGQGIIYGSPHAGGACNYPCYYIVLQASCRAGNVLAFGVLMCTDYHPLSPSLLHCFVANRQRSHLQPDGSVRHEHVSLRLPLAEDENVRVSTGSDVAPPY